VKVLVAPTPSVAWITTTTKLFAVVPKDGRATLSNNVVDKLQRTSAHQTPVEPTPFARLATTNPEVIDPSAPVLRDILETRC